MRCDEVAEVFGSLSADGSPELIDQLVEAHLRRCDRCRVGFRAPHWLLAELAALRHELVEVPAGAVDEVLAAVTARSWFRGWRAAAALGGLAAATAGAASALVVRRVRLAS
jgi:predicted anti-sigma-YlaC factor YlaD